MAGVRNISIDLGFCPAPVRRRLDCKIASAEHLRVEPDQASGDRGQFRNGGGFGGAAKGPAHGDPGLRKEAARRPQEEAVRARRVSAG
jgi:hypothetical protein